MNKKKSFLATQIKNLFNRKKTTRFDRKTLCELIENYKKSSLIDPETADMLEGVLDISELRVRDIMIPRSQIVTLKSNLSLNECLSIIIDSSHSRFPVVTDDDNDNVKGFLLAKDLLQILKNHQAEFKISNILRPAFIVPESKRVDQMLKEFRSKRYHMAIVVDEFGGISGLVTIEDILELIVGEIEDEFDELEDSNFRLISPNIFSVKASTSIEEFNEYFKTKFESDDADTIGGLIMQTFGHLPHRGEIIEINNFNFKINIVDNRKIIQLLVTIPNNKT